TPGWVNPDLLNTIVSRFGRGFPIDSNVFRPITTMWPVVVFLNHAKSSGRCHGIRLPSPITRFFDIAAIAFISASDGDGRLDGRVRIVPGQGKILELELVDVCYGRVEG